MKQDSGKLVLSLETLMRLQAPPDAEANRGGTHPTTTVNTIHTGCC